MENDRVKEVFWKAYNDFWNKWKNIPLARQSPEWEAMTAEGREIMEKYRCDLCNHMVSDLIQILKERYEIEEQRKL